ncbi:MAG TPA: ATP-binding protein [Kofleriaceae bacterium]|nr:ATP-binding protein [Kofleriaceae bacterium]
MTVSIGDRRTQFLSRALDPTEDHRGRPRRLLERAIRQRWSDGRLIREPAARPGAEVAALEIERLMRPAAPITDVVEDHRYDAASVVGQTFAALGLSPTEADLFAVLLACEVDPTSARLASYLSGAAHAAALSADMLFEIIYRPRRLTFGNATAQLHADLAAERLGRRLGLLVLDGEGSRQFLAQTVRMHPRLVTWLLGRGGLDPELAAHARMLPPSPPRAEIQDLAQLADVVGAFEATGRIVNLDGTAGVGRELLLCAAAHQLGRPLLIVSARGLEPHLITSAFREAALHGALLAFESAEELFTAEGTKRLREQLAAYPGTIALTGLAASGPLASSLRPTLTLRLALPPYRQRLELWRAQLGDGAALAKDQWHEIAGLYNLGIGGIARACDLARQLAATRREVVGRDHVAHAVRQMFDGELSTVAKRVEVSQTWEDVVLPEDIVDSIMAIVDRVTYRNKVLGDWGFGRKVGKGMGLTVLFSGLPGTGKSMLAGLIARELGLDMYVIDLSRVTSKWLGETEKNLARAFDAAEAGHVLLLFDEADSVLGKRTMDVKSANDRHANLETNFVLARLEQFAGVAVFTTNIASAIDPAIIRRMSANITIPFPDLEARIELWRRMIPAEAPVASDIDFVGLARCYEVSGGFIRNMVLRAAFMAAREHAPISMAHLEHAARGEYADRGSLTSGGRL